MADQFAVSENQNLPDDFYGWRSVIIIFGSIYVLLFLAGAVAAHTDYPWLALLLLPFIGAQIYKMTIIMHDACHFSLFRDRKLNQRVGQAAGFFVGSDFDTFRRLHWKHHAKYGEEGDPQGDDYLHLEQASRGHLIWHLLRPLFGYNLFKVFLFRPYAAPTEGAANLSEAPKSRVSLLVGTFLVHTSLALTATLAFTVWWTLILFPVAAATFGLFFSQARGFAEHVAAPDKVQSGYARTHLPNWFDKLFFYTLNFNYHIEHHAHPSVPSCQLPKLHEEMRKAPGYELSPSIMRTIWQRCMRGIGAGI